MLTQLSATDHAALNSYHPRSVEAYFLQLQARAELSRIERAAAFRALVLFQRALALDAGYAMAYAGLASTYQLLTSTTLQRAIAVHEGARLAREAAERALALDEGLAEAYAALGRLKMSYDWDWQGAEEHMQRAVALSPNSVEVVETYGWFLTAMGRLQEALEMLTRARGLDPLRRQTLEFLGATHWMAGDAARALAMLADAVALDPQVLRPRFRRLIILDHLKREDEAMAERTTWLVLAGEAQLAERLSALCRSEGYSAVVREWIDLLERQGQWYDIADQWMTLDQPERALDALERCLEERHTYVPFMLRHPVFRPLHGEPRFRRLAPRLDMPEPAQARSTEPAAASVKASR